jgi:hypothetical protein
MTVVTCCADREQDVTIAVKWLPFVAFAHSGFSVVNYLHFHEIQFLEKLLKTRFFFVFTIPDARISL